jgi:hypothetical protein
MDFLRRLLRHAVTAIVALVLLFEEWGWEPLAAWLARLGRLPVFAWMERRIVALPPWGALVLFAAPALALLPVKLLALFLIGRGHPMLGVAVLLGAKVAGTALLARLFSLTQPTLMRLAWFARWYPRWKDWKDCVIAQVKDSNLWRAAARQRAAAAALWQRFRRSLGLGGPP